MKALLSPVLVLACLGARAEPVSRYLPLSGQITLEMVLVPAGEIVQGSPEAEPGRGADETPRRVRLSADFYIGATPVTRGQWAAFARETGYRTEAEIGTSGGFGWDGAQVVQKKEFTWRNPGFPQDDAHPVCIVTFPDAEAFCAWASRKTGLTVTLPTEAQWEYACRAGTTGAWHNGGDEAACDRIAWHKRNAGNTTHPVASTQPNAWGLRMGGNVAEWCLDWYAPYAPLDGVVADPVQRDATLSDKPRRVLRGGSWAREPRNTRSAARFRSDPRSRNADIGFRVVASVLPAQPVEAAAPVAHPPPPPPPLEMAVPASETPPASTHEVSPHLPDYLSQSPSFLETFFGVLRVLVPLYLGYRVLRFFFRRDSSPRKPADSPARQLGTALGALGAMPAAGDGQGVRIEADGFWFTRSQPSGTRFRYTVLARNQSTSGRVRYKPGPNGHFVYLGFQPDQVALQREDDEESDPSAHSRDHTDTHRSDRPTSYPSAY